MPPRFFCSRLPVANLSAPAPAPGISSEIPSGHAIGSGADRPGDVFCILGPEETRHARKVLRLSVGDAIEVFDGGGRLADAEIVEYRQSKGEAETRCRVGAVREVPRARPRLVVASAVPKGPRAEAMVNQLGQLGADVFVPVQSARGVVEPGAGKVERYEKAALASAKQSGRPWRMVIEFPTTLAELLGRSQDGVRLILDPRGSAIPALGDRLASADEVVVLVGPEGGWTDEELADAEAAGFVRWRMAEHVLRIEAAATAATAILRYVQHANG